MLFPFLSWVLELAVLYVSPLASTLKSLQAKTSGEQSVWLVHWVLVAIAHLIVYPVIELLSSDILVFVLRLVALVLILKGNSILRSQLDSIFFSDDSLVNKTNNQVREILKAQLSKFGLIKQAQE